MPPLQPFFEKCDLEGTEDIDLGIKEKQNACEM